MAESIFNLVSVAAAASGPITSGAGAAASCPIFYPADLAALQGLPPVPRVPAPPAPGAGADAGLGRQVPGLQGYVSEIDDTLRFSILVTSGPKTVTFYGTRIDPNGQISRFSQTVTGNSSTVPATAFITTGAGLLQGLGATVDGGIGTAIILVLAELGNITNGVFFPRLQLLSGLLTGFGVAPGTTNVVGGAGPGVGGNSLPSTFEQISSAGPATSIEMSYTSPATVTRARVVRAQVQFTMSAVAARRGITLILKTNSVDVFNCSLSAYPTASTFGFVNSNMAGSNMVVAPAVVTDGWTGNIPIPETLWGVGTLVTRWQIDAAQAGDVIHSATATIESQ